MLKVLLLSIIPLRAGSVHQKQIKYMDEHVQRRTNQLQRRTLTRAEL